MIYNCIATLGQGTLIKIIFFIAKDDTSDDPLPNAILSCCPQDHPSPTRSVNRQMPCFHKQENMCHICAHMHMDTHKVVSVYV